MYLNKWKQNRNEILKGEKDSKLDVYMHVKSSYNFEKSLLKIKDFII